MTKLIITTLINITLLTTAHPIEVNNLFHKEPQIEKIKIIATGDIMMHDAQIEAGYNSDDESYNYNDFFSEVKPLLQSGDITIGNLETTLGDDKTRYAGYPSFNAPKQLATNLKDSGFTLLSTANNHSLDRGAIGVENTIKFLDEINLNHIGTNLSDKYLNNPLILDQENTSFSFLSYTYGTNGISEPSDRQYLVNNINKEQILIDIEKSKENDVDIIVASIHFGNEYHRSPNDFQKKLVDFLFENDVDIILGSHPHVLQPYEMRIVNGEKKFVIYSLGNFVSNQRHRYQDASIILEINILNNIDEDEITIDSVDYHPTWVYKYLDNGVYNYKILLSENRLNNDTSLEDMNIPKEEFDKLEESYYDAIELLN